MDLQPSKNEAGQQPDSSQQPKDLTPAEIEEYGAIPKELRSPSNIVIFPHKMPESKEPVTRGDELNIPQKKKAGRPRKLDKGDPGKVLSSFFSASAAQQIAEYAAGDQVSVSEWLKRAALEKLDRIANPRLL